MTNILADISNELGLEVEGCPFCGDATGQRDRRTMLIASDNEWGIGWQVVCSFCGGRGPVATSEKPAVFAWNRRQA